MKRLFILLISGLLLAAGCNKPDKGQLPPTDNGENSSGDAKLEMEGAAQGSMIYKGSTMEITGKYKIADGRLVISALMGNLEGTVTVDEDSNYHITFDKLTGAYEDIIGLTGTIAANTGKKRSASPTSEDTYIPEIALEAAELTNGNIALYNFHYLQGLKLKKCIVFFSHSKYGREAEVHIKNSSYNTNLPLGAYYSTISQDSSEVEENNLCEIWPGPFGLYTDGYESGYGDYYHGQYNNNFFYDEDNPYVIYLRYVLDKETEYEYEVVWDNGIKEKGHFTTNIGGTTQNICIGDMAGGYQRAYAYNNFPLSKFANTTICYEYPDQGLYVKSALTMQFARDYNIYIYSMPKETSGVFSLADSNIPQSEGLKARLTFPDGTKDGKSYFPTGGYIKKTGRWSFEYEVEFNYGGSTQSVTGKGEYIFK